MRRSRGILLGGIAALVAAVSAHAQTIPSMPLGRATSAPAGYMTFCARQPDQCGEFAGHAMAEASPLSAFWRDAFSDRTSAVGEVDQDLRRVPERLFLTPALLAELHAVNRSVNVAIAPANDRDADTWTLPLADGRRTGDCEDYVLEKRRALIAHGVPAKALSIAVVRTLRGETHAVLVAATEAGELVLDNRSTRIVAWNETGYRWVKRQSPTDPARWVRVAAY